MKSNTVLQVPYGTCDLLPNEAALRRVIEDKIAKVFNGWGYDEVKTPTFEYLDTFIAAEQELDDSFKFLDRHNNILVLRSDMTTPIARLVATRLKETNDIKRLFYVANLFRYEQIQAGKQCEFTQAGVEMLGAANPSADAEILALAIKALLETGIKDFKLSIGQIDFINGLLEDAKLSESNAKEVKKALIKHDVVKLENLIETSTIEPKKKELLKRLPFLHGDIDLLTEVLNYDLNEKSKNAIADLKAIYDLLKVYGVTEYLSFDLGLLRDFDYYTGMLFEGYAMEIGFPIIGGGRYDKMMQNFGEPAPATGFAIGMDRVMLVLSRQNYCYNVKKANIFVGYADNCLLKAIKKVTELRAMGNNVTLAMSAMNKAEAKKAATKDELIYITE